jgi:membrane protease YdiL (CAAX protease family)
VDPAPPITEPTPAATPPATILPIERAAAALEVLLCSGYPTQIIVIAFLASLRMRPLLPNGEFNPPFVFALTLLDTILLVGLILVFFRAHGESLRAQLFARPAWGEIPVGIALIPASFLVIVVVLVLVQTVAPFLRNVPHNPLSDLAKTKLNAMIFAFVVIVAGGVREEIQRGFALRRFEQYLGGGGVGLAVFSPLFGLGHLDQGYNVALATAVLGAVWGAVFLRRRSVAAPMIGHAGFDLAQVIILMRAA